MSVVRVYSGPYGHLRGLGDDPSTSDVFSSGYDPLAPPPTSGDMGVPYANLPAYSGGYPDVQPPLASTGYTPVDVTNATSPPPPTPTAGIPGIVAAGVQTIASATGTSRPSPVLNVPLSSSSLGLWFSGTTFGLPTWMVLGGGLLFAVAIIGGGSRGRR